jgi:hypothetical protein
MKNSSRMVHRLRNAAVIIGLSGALVGGVAGVAEASQGATLGPGQSQSFSTWFFGRTEVCFQDVSQHDASYYWISATTHGGGGLTPNSPPVCMARSFVGLGLWVSNNSAQGTIQVTFPLRP